jgi:photosystem II stability/assembly factor-like uncharacterized protein
MSVDIERRLRAALEAYAEAITQPTGSVDYHPRTNCDVRTGQASMRRSRRVRWTGPALAATAVVLLAVGAAATIQTVNSHRGEALSPSPRPTTAPSPSAAPTNFNSQLPLAGPDVTDAALFAGGLGYAHTQNALLWTENFGATWRNITPPGLTEAQLQSASILLRPDGHQWIAVAPIAGSTTMTLLRRSSTSQSWTRTSIAIGPLTISPYGVATTSISFSDADHGWLLVAEHFTPHGSGELLRTTDGGAHWTLQLRQSSMPAAGTLHFLTEQLGYLDANTAGSAGWWVTHDGGQTWALFQIPTPTAKNTDNAAIIGAPSLAGDAIVMAVSFTTPVQGTSDGVGIYRSTDLGASWTTHQIASDSPAEQYSFSAAPDGSVYVLLRMLAPPDVQTITWVTSRSTNAGETFTDTTSVQNFYPGPLTLADPDNLWTVGDSDGCTGFKSGCWNTSGLIASHDGGTSWQQVSLP